MGIEPAVKMITDPKRVSRNYENYTILRRNKNCVIARQYMKGN
jgi:hypothetical protein